jgi:hypothetical protein
MFYAGKSLVTSSRLAYLKKMLTCSAPRSPLDVTSICEQKETFAAPSDMMRRKYNSRSQWLRGLRRTSAAARLLGLWVWIPPAAWTSVYCECCVLWSAAICQAKVSDELWDSSKYRSCNVVVRRISGYSDVTSPRLGGQSVAFPWEDKHAVMSGGQVLFAHACCVSSPTLRHHFCRNTFITSFFWMTLRIFPKAKIQEYPTSTCISNTGDKIVLCNPYIA